jgi:hypothetical protein
MNSNWTDLFNSRKPGSEGSFFKAVMEIAEYPAIQFASLLENTMNSVVNFLTP